MRPAPQWPMDQWSDPLSSAQLNRLAQVAINAKRLQDVPVFRALNQITPHALFFDDGDDAAQIVAAWRTETTNVTTPRHAFGVADVFCWTPLNGWGDESPATLLACYILHGQTGPQ